MSAQADCRKAWGRFSRAVERFGLGREIAAQFAADSIDRQVRRTWVALAVIVTFVAMRLRVMWLDDGAAAALAPIVDRYAFIGALTVGLVGWFACRRSVAALVLCLGGLAASIAAGIVRAGLFAGGAPLHVVLSAADQADGGLEEGRPMNGWRLSGILSLLIGVMTFGFMASHGGDIEGVPLAIRATARTSLVLFALAFTASAMAELVPSQATRWQRCNRRYLGVSFAVSHFIHLAVILALASVDHELFWKLTNVTTIVLAGSAYLFIAAMAATSFDRAWLGSAPASGGCCTWSAAGTSGSASPAPSASACPWTRSTGR